VPANSWNRGALAALTVLTVLATVYVAVPDGALSDVWYDAVGVCAALHAWWGVHRRRRAQVGAWRLIAAGFGLWALGDV
jgi:hypothetical protein